MIKNEPSIWSKIFNETWYIWLHRHRQLQLKPKTLPPSLKPTFTSLSVSPLTCLLSFDASPSLFYTFCFLCYFIYFPHLLKCRKTKKNVYSEEVLGIKTETSLLQNLCKCLIYPSFHFLYLLVRFTTIYHFNIYTYKYIYVCLCVSVSVCLTIKFKHGYLSN